MTVATKSEASTIFQSHNNKITLSVSSVASHLSFSPTVPTLVLPRSSAEDDRVKPVFQELTQQLEHQGLRFQLTVKDGRDITHGDGIVILPCIAASRVGSDLAAALDKAKLGEWRHSSVRVKARSQVKRGV